MHGAPRLIESVNGGKITNCPLIAIDIRRIADIFGRCRSCEAARASTPQATPSDSQPAERVAERVHVGILFTKGKGEKKQKLLISSVDEYSGFIYIVELTHLTKAEV
jgi:hypothetical protein